MWTWQTLSIFKAPGRFFAMTLSSYSAEASLHLARVSHIASKNAMIIDLD